MYFMWKGLLAAFLLGLILTLAARHFTQTEVFPLEYGHRVVVALSSTPEHLPYMEPTLKSLIDDQKLPASMVHLILPEAQTDSTLDYRPLPEFINLYVKQGKLLVIQPERGYGPIDAVVYGIEMESYDTRVIFADDRLVYGSKFVSGLFRKSYDHPDAVVAYSGAILRSFRKIGNHRPETRAYPHLFFQTSGTKTFSRESKIDIVRKWAGVCVQRRFFDIPSLKQLVEGVPQQIHHDASDFILSAHLEKQGVDRVLVDKGRMPSLAHNVPENTTMFEIPLESAMEAAFFLQQNLSIWERTKFLNFQNLSMKEKEAIRCDAREDCHGGEWKNQLAKIEKLLQHRQ